jgi:hypothetical protein
MMMSAAMASISEWFAGVRVPKNIAESAERGLMTLLERS